MHYTYFSLQNSIKNLKSLDQEERKISLKIIEELYEIEKRKAYADLKYCSLYVFCIKELRFTEYQTHQRIQAMRAIKATPELKERIQSGKTNITNIAQIQTFLRHEQVEAGVKRTPEQKLELFTLLEEKTSREVKEELSQLRGERIKRKLIIELDEEAESLWGEVQNKLAHQSLGNDLNCLKVLMKNILKNEPSENSSRRTSSGSNKQTRYIPKAIKIEVKSKAEHQCINCGSKYALQIEHKKPYSLKGGRDLDNLELLCRSCNLHRGIRIFGAEKMRRN